MQELFAAGILIFTAGVALLALPLLFLFPRAQARLCDVLVSPWRCTECGVRVSARATAQQAPRGRFARTFGCPCALRPVCEARMRRAAARG